MIMEKWGIQYHKSDSINYFSFCGEHSMMDATPTNRLCELLCEELANTLPEKPVGPSKQCQEIEFLLTPRVLQYIKQAEHNTAKLV